MPEQKKQPPVREVPKDLPLPAYDYQKPAGGSFTVKYDANRERDRKSPQNREPLASLQNLKLAL